MSMQSDDDVRPAADAEVAIVGAGPVGPNGRESARRGRRARSSCSNAIRASGPAARDRLRRRDAASLCPGRAVRRDCAAELMQDPNVVHSMRAADAHGGGLPARALWAVATGHLLSAGFRAALLAGTVAVRNGSGRVRPRGDRSRPGSELASTLAIATPNGERTNCVRNMSSAATGARAAFASGSACSSSVRPISSAGS